VQAALAEARRVLQTPVIEHIGGHAMALFELAALHLEREAATGGEEKPDLPEASLAIDAMAALVEGLGDKLQPYRAQLQSALDQLRMAFVRLS
jgi:adenylosuccinate lyase